MPTTANHATFYAFMKTKEVQALTRPDQDGLSINYLGMLLNVKAIELIFRNMTSRAGIFKNQYDVGVYSVPTSRATNLTYRATFPTPA